MTDSGTEIAKQREHGAVAVAPESGLLSAIVQMAKDPAVDVTKLKEILLMQERLEARQAEREFIAAFSRLSADLPRVKKNGTISLGADKAGRDRGSIAFAKWEDMDTIIRPAMTREGFTLSFDSAIRQAEGGGIVVSGTLMHRDGHTRTASIPLPLDTGPGRNNLQAMGSTLSYGKRYCAEMLLNIVREGIDDDGKMGGTRFITDAQIKELEDLLVQTKTDRDRFLQVFEIAVLSNLEIGAFAAAKNMLHSKLKVATGPKS